MKHTAMKLLLATFILGLVCAGCSTQDTISDETILEKNNVPEHVRDEVLSQPTLQPGESFR